MGNFNGPVLGSDACELYVQLYPLHAAPASVTRIQYKEEATIYNAMRCLEVWRVCLRP